MRKTLGVSLLVLLLTGSASAGIMGNDTPAPSSQSQPTSEAQEPMEGETVNGEMSTPGVTDALTQIALELLASVLP
jgi:hypothetical protein